MHDSNTNRPSGADEYGCECLWGLVILFNKSIIGKGGVETGAAGEALQVGDAQKLVIGVHKVQKQSLVLAMKPLGEGVLQLVKGGDSAGDRARPHAEGFCGVYCYADRNRGSR